MNLLTGLRDRHQDLPSSDLLVGGKALEFTASIGTVLMLTRCRPDWAQL